MNNKRENLLRKYKSFIVRLFVALMVLAAILSYSIGSSEAASAPKLTESSLKLSVGKQYDMNVRYKTNKSSYKWSTNNDKVATVSQKGIVKAYQKGSALITCKVTSHGKIYILSCKVTVSEKATSVTPPSTITPVPTPTVIPYTGKTAMDVVKEMGNGWNLGNTMEAIPMETNPTARECETAWGQPVTTKTMIDGLKASGFNSIRIPVAWSTTMSKDGKYTISADYFQRIDEIISYVLDNNMYAIINDHWDGGWWDDFGSKDEAKRNEAMKKYEMMWKQIVDHYATYSDHLIFESANEELGWDYPSVNKVNQRFVDVVRSSGENNKTRYLLIAGINTDIDKTCDSKFVMPKDVIPQHLMISVHYYSPSTFCIASKQDNGWGYMDRWGSDDDKKLMRSYFEKMKIFTDKGYGVIIGEYGVTKRDDGTVKTGTDQFFNSVVSFAKEYHYCAMLWDCNEWYDRNTSNFKDQAIASIYK